MKMSEQILKRQRPSTIENHEPEYIYAQITALQQ